MFSRAAPRIVSSLSRKSPSSISSTHKYATSNYIATSTSLTSSSTFTSSPSTSFSATQSSIPSFFSNSGTSVTRNSTNNSNSLSLSGRWVPTTVSHSIPQISHNCYPQSEYLLHLTAFARLAWRSYVLILFFRRLIRSPSGAFVCELIIDDGKLHTIPPHPTSPSSAIAIFVLFSHFPFVENVLI